MIEYDPKVIQSYAERLIKESKSVVSMSFFIGLLSGMITFGGVTALFNIGYDFPLIAVGVLTGAVLGYGAGQNRAAEMRLAAQQALCQLKIEEHLRKK